MYWKVLEECIQIAKKREQEHGRYEDNFKIYAEAWGGHKKKAIERGMDALILLKLGRMVTNLKNNKAVKEDTLLDLINYIAMKIHWGRRVNDGTEI